MKRALISHENLIQVLDLKQKQASVMEAAYTRSQSQETVRQGKTIMIFTITTIVFLPVPFPFSFFAINIEELSSAGKGLNLSFVLKYVLGRGLAMMFLLTLVAFNVTRIKDMARKARASMAPGPPSTRSRQSHGSTGRLSESQEEHEMPKPAVLYSSQLIHRFNDGTVTPGSSKEPNALVRMRTRDLESG